MLERLLAKRHISHLDLSSVRATLVEKKSWTVDRAERVEGDYKRFLYAMARKGQGDIISPPDQDVDEFWHQHILDTRKYRADCDTIFGHYVDHIPGLGPEEQRNADVRRLQVYQEYDIDLIGFETSDGGSDGADPDCGGPKSGHAHGHSAATTAGEPECDPVPGHSSGHGHSSTGHISGSDSGHGSSGHSSGSDNGHSGSGDNGGGGDSGGGDGGGGDGGGGDGGGGCGGGGCGGE